MPTNIEFIMFAVQQAQAAQEFGFTRNECCRNLKTTLHQHWQHKTLGLHGQSQKKNIPRSIEAQNKPLCECQVEHVVPLMWIVNKLMDMEVPTQRKIKSILQKYYRVLLVTNDEHDKLNASGLRSVMPDDWDEKSVWARYDEVGIHPAER